MLLAVFPADHATAARATPTGAVVLLPDRGPHRRVAPPNAGCRFVAAGAGRLVWSCADGLAVSDLDDGDIHSVPDPAATPDAEEDSSIYDIEQVGTDWLGGTFASDHGPNTSYFLNLHTGAPRY